MDENIILVTDEDGNEYELEILFTFDDEENNKSYVLLKALDDSEEIFPYSYNDDGELMPIEDEKEWKMCEEVLNAFIDEGLLDE